MKIKTHIFLTPLILLISVYTKAQTPSDALMMDKQEWCIAVIHQYDTWDKYWEGTLLRENQNIGVLTRNSVMPMMAYGITERFNAIITLPYVATEASGGQMVGASGWQDLGVFLKIKAYEVIKKSGTFSAFVTGGYSLPVTSYLSDYMPFSLGLGTQEFSVRPILKYEHKSGIYVRGSYAYLHRTTTEAERDYYYADKGYYTTTMDVPSASQAELSLGSWLCKHSLQLEVSAISQTSLSGDDIRRQNQAQPTNKMNFTNANARIRYFPDFLKGLSIIGGYTQFLHGRNIGKSSIISGGFTYQFSLSK